MNHQNKTPSACKQLGASRKNQRLHFTLAAAKDLLPWCIAGLAVASVLTHCAHDAHGTHLPNAGRGKVSAALKGAGAENTQQLSVATPTGKRGFVTSQSLAGAAASGLHGLGRDGAIRKDARTTSCVFSHPAHLMPLKTATGGFKSQLGA